MSAIHQGGMLLLMWSLEALAHEPFCESLAHPCLGEARLQLPMTFGHEKAFWRCADGLCIDGPGRCNGQLNCFDRSDELGCSGRGSHVPALSPAMAEAFKRCSIAQEAKGISPQLLTWWII